MLRRIAVVAAAFLAGACTSVRVRPVDARRAWQGVKTKMDPVIDELLAGYRRGAPPSE